MVALPPHSYNSIAMTGKFGIQINPELILKLTEPDKYHHQGSLDFFPKPPPKAIVKPEPETPSQTLAPPVTSPLPPPPEKPVVAAETLAPSKLWKAPVSLTPDRREDEVLEPLRKVAAECEQVVESLRKQEGKEREEVQRRAREIQSKQYQAPQPKPVPCPDEQRACIVCLTENRDNPLKCQDIIKAYSLCAEQVRQRFVSSGFSFPQVNS